MLKELFKNVADKFKKKEQIDLYYGYYFFGHYEKQAVWDLEGIANVWMSKSTRVFTPNSNWIT